MKPLRLTIQAFGPYPGREVVDYREAVNSGLFGIYGQTGSGKSTIFSAMTFALFGESAKPDQEATSFRSDHADAATTTEVEFVFDLGDKRFVILRRPEQMRPKKVGGGDTKILHEAHFFDATGLQLEDIRDGQRGKIIAEKKVGVVDEAICGVLGYRSEQFRQIVLLPQGKFETFLTSKTKDRLSILRELFDISLYRRLTEKLKLEADEAEKAVRQEREYCTRQLNAENFESIDALASGITGCENQLASLVEVEDVANQQWNRTQQQHTAAESLEAKFINAERAVAQLAKISSHSEEMAILEARVARAQKVQSLKDVEDVAIRAARDLGDARTKMDEARKRVGEAKETANQAAAALVREEDRSGEIQSLTAELFTLQSHKDTIKTAAGLFVELGQTRAAEKKASDNLNLAQSSLSRSQQQLRGKKVQWDDAVTAIANRKEQVAKLGELNNELKTAIAFESTEEGIVNAEADVDRLDTELKIQIGAEQTEISRYEEAEGQLSEVQALHLASKLGDGMPCPVCGATVHPHPATGRIENEGLDQAFRSAKKALDAAKGKSEAAGRQLTQAHGVLAERRLQFVGLEKPERTAEAIRGEIGAVQKIHDQIVVGIDPSAAKNEFDDLNLKLDIASQNQVAKQGSYDDTKNRTAGATARYEQAISSVPEKLRVSEILEAALVNAQAELKKRRDALVAAVKADGNAKSADVRANTEAEGATGTVNDCLHRHQEINVAFQNRLVEIGMTEPEYQALKPAVASIVNDQQIVDDHKFALKIASQTASATAFDIQGQVQPDLIVEEAKRKTAHESLNKAMELSFGAKERLKRLNELRGRLSDTLRLLDEAEVKSGPLRNMAAFCSGANPLRLDLETFAIGAMFDQALQAANLRLMPMTSNRYRLERDIVGSGNGRRGLGIQAFDAYTGKSRATSTLSGGETFIFALALALGLADVVESISGKVRLDTIFIDEGFGSLDTENESGTLDQVLHALGSLVKKSRAVGLISHVPLVQEAIPNGFYVRKTTTGSTIETRGTM